MKLVAFVKGKTHAGEGGMIVEMPFEDKHDLNRIFHFARNIHIATGKTATEVTVVSRSRKKIESPFIYPEMASQANPDGSFYLGASGKMWFEHIITIDLDKLGEEE